MNRIDSLFQIKRQKVLNVYCTAGYPHLNSITEVLRSLEANGADIVEIGIPYSDPLADGPVIQQSNMIALQNGMTLPVLFEQLKAIRKEVELPIILMGYMNPVLQFGIERFCAEAKAVGVDGLILPDLPIYEFETEHRAVFEKYGLRFIFLVTPETSDERIKQLDALSSGFLYAVSSSSTTGGDKSIEDQDSYFRRLKELDLGNPVLVGFGIKDKASFNAACAYTNGAIIGSAYIRELEKAEDINRSTKEFLNRVLG